MFAEQSVNDSTTQFDSLVLSQYYFDGLAVTGTLNVNNLSITGSAYSSLDSGTIAVAGNLTASDPSFHGAGTIDLVGTGTVTGSNGGQLPSVVINTTGNITFSGTIGVLGDWTYTAGTVNAAGSTIAFDNTNMFVTQHINAGSMQFDSVVLADGWFDSISLTGTLTTDNLTISGNTNFALDGGTIDITKTYGNSTVSYNNTDTSFQKLDGAQIVVV
jgi:hypothetical protein